MRRDALFALALLACGFAATLWIEPWSDERVNDLYVYRLFADPVLDGSLPYRDVFFEYPPLGAPAIVLPGVVGTGAEVFRWAFAGWTLLLAACVTFLCGALAARSDGDRRRALLAAAAAPLLCGAMIRTHFDLAPVAVLLLALLLLCAGRPRLGMATLGVAAMVKGFPLAAAPPALAWLWARSGRREALAGAAALVGTVVAVSLAAVAISPGGALDAVQYHLERPVQVESTPALVLGALDALGAGELTRVSSHRSDGLEHPAADAVAAAFAALLVLALGALSVLAAAPRSSLAPGPSALTGPAGRPPPPAARRLLLSCLAAVLAFGALGKVLSPQYLIWTIPLGALAFAWRMHALALTVAAATLLTLLEFPARYFDVVAREPFALGVVTLRNVALLAALALCFRELAPARVRQPAAAAARSA
jgi:hypothetical protein